MPPKKALPVAPPRVNPLRNRKPINAPILNRPTKVVSRSTRACCDTPDLHEGVCHACGRIVDESNIVAEVQFGETSTGAAVVQGSYVGADQGTARTMGPAFKRAGGTEQGANTTNEGKSKMNMFRSQLGINENIGAVGMGIFKLASNQNFIQGRRMDVVVAVCLYTACRTSKPCNVMLIDFADKIQVNVFKLGRTFKALHRAVTLDAFGMMPLLPEDLIWRFCKALDFGTDTARVAEDAVRIAQRMSLDWMVMGRRPSGVCGACIILAARMNNFRRTVTEVVYVVKVTTVTIQKRLEEFKITPSASLTVEDFLHNEFLESAHDPPSFYEKTEEFQKQKKKRKKRVRIFDDNEEDAEEAADDNDVPVTEPAHKRQRTNNFGHDEPLPSVEVRRDADGFVIPAPPVQSHEIPIDPALLDEDEVIEDQTGTSFEKLVAAFGDHPEMAEMDERLNAGQDGSASADDSEGKVRDGRSRVPKAIHVPQEWSADEEELASQIDEIVHAPGTIHEAEIYAESRDKAVEQIRALDRVNPPQVVSMDVHIGEDEFADDPEVQNCLLSEEDAAIREQVWTNLNRDWLRKQQLKEWAKKQEANGPPKARRNRKKKSRIGEGQDGPANSPLEAATSALEKRSFSRKINYSALTSVVNSLERIQNGYGSAATSQVTSRAGSDVSSEVSRSRASSIAASSQAEEPENPDHESLINLPRSREERNRLQQAKRGSNTGRRVSRSASGPDSIVPDDEDDGADESDFIDPATTAARTSDVDDWRAQLDPDDAEEDVDDVGMGGISDDDDHGMASDGGGAQPFGGSDVGDEDEDDD